MINTSSAFNFEHIPLNIDRSSIKVFQHAKDTFSLEYAIFQPRTVRINMYPVKYGWIRKKNSERGLATICQFASAMGLHPDFHKISQAPIQLILDMLQTKFQVDPEDPNYPTYHCGGILVIEDQPQKMVTLTDDILEILTDDPQFAFVQFVFKSIKLPKELQPEVNVERRLLSRAHFDIQKGKIERWFKPVYTNIMEETGCFEFSPRILVVETDIDSLKTKLDRLQSYSFPKDSKLGFIQHFGDVFLISRIFVS
ncbi:MAG: hypothetical protein ACFE95_00310 [Candidatus Hodarchaeota archaeon]